MKLKLLIEGGNMQPGPSVAQKVGPLGINMGKVIQKINSATQDFKGLKVPVELDINPETKDFEVEVFSPPVAELIKKELGIDKGSGEQAKLKAGNLAIEQAIKVAKTKYQNMLDKTLKQAVKSVIGSCVSLGVLVESEEPKKVISQIDSGKYDKEIEEEKTEASEEKLQKLQQRFEAIREKEEEIIRKEEEEAEVEEEEPTEEQEETEAEAEVEKEEGEKENKEVKVKEKKQS